MPVPKSKISKSKRGMRRSHNFLVAKGVSECPNCNNVKLPHRVCPHCGHYKGKEIIASKATAE